MKSKVKHTNYVDKIIEVFTDTDNTIGIFEELNIGQFDEIQSVKKYDRPDGRKGLVITANMKGQKSDSTMICIDVKESLPATEQLREVIYGTGADCDVRLIVFRSLKDESDDDDPTTDFNFIKDIVDAKNEYGLNIYLMNFFEPQPEDKHYHFHVFAAPVDRPKYSIDDIETELQFREGEFWICLVNSLDKDFYKNWPSPDGRFHDLGHHVDVGGVRVKIVWDEQGSKIAVYQTDSGNDFVRDIWKAKKSDLRKLFEGQDINLEQLSERLQMITVGISDRPVSWLLKAQARLHEKLDFARALHQNYLKMVDFVRDVN
jgi:hypothetical protein